MISRKKSVVRALTSGGWPMFPRNQDSTHANPKSSRPSAAPSSNPWRQLARAPGESPAPRRFAVKTDTDVSKPRPKTSGT